jgi:predicted RNase H-like HicB family nuclease
MKVKALIEKGNDGTYGVYIDLEENRLSYSVIGDGKTVKEAIDDFNNSYEEMKAYYKDADKKFTEVVFEFEYDVASFLNYYASKLSKSGLESITGINQKQLGHYSNGQKRPRAETVKKIQSALHDFGKELSQVQLIK